MKNLSIILSCFLMLAACHRKTVPAKTQGTTVAPKPATPAPSKNNNTEVAPAKPAPTAPPAAVYTKPVIVVDGKGNMVSEDQLPEGVSLPDNSVARAFTPAQTKNLAYRYKYIPPKVLYVPSNLAKTTSRGTYYVYNKKFWYWKKSDGFFYLDPNYYN